MKTWHIVLVAIVVPAGGLLALAIWLAKELHAQHEAERSDLVPRWRKFMESEPVIPAANVPPIRERKAERTAQAWHLRRFPQRGAR